LEIHSETEILELRDGLGGHDRASLEIPLETEIELNSEMRLEAEMEYFRDEVGGHDRVTHICTWRLRSG
jgi:hypothetical protein